MKSAKVSSSRVNPSAFSTWKNHCTATPIRKKTGTVTRTVMKGSQSHSVTMV